MKITYPALALLVLLAGCSAAPVEEPGPAPTVTVTMTEPAEPAPTVTVTVSAKPSTAAPSTTAAAGLLAIGDIYPGKPKGATLQVLEMRQATDRLSDSLVTGLKIRACNTGDETSVFSSQLWVGVDADEGRYEATRWDVEGLSPSYPRDEFDPKSETEPGECLAGWITFEADNLVSVRYRSQANGEASWALPTA